MDLRRVRRWEWLTGLAGLVLLVSLFLHWYDGASAWQAFTVIDVVLAIAALGAMALPVVTAAQRTAAVPQGTTALLMPVALVAALLALIRLVNPPGSGAEREIGVWLGTVAAFAVFYLNSRSMGDARTPHAMRSRLDVATLPAPTPDGERRDLAT
jgi:cation transport ATPase